MGYEGLRFLDVFFYVFFGVLFDSYNCDILFYWDFWVVCLVVKVKEEEDFYKYFVEYDEFELVVYIVRWVWINFGEKWILFKIIF